MPAHRQLLTAKMDGHKTVCAPGSTEYGLPHFIRDRPRMGSQDYHPIFESQVSSLPDQSLSTILLAPWLVISLALPLLLGLTSDPSGESKQFLRIRGSNSVAFGSWSRGPSFLCSQGSSLLHLE